MGEAIFGMFVLVLEGLFVLIEVVGHMLMSVFRLFGRRSQNRSGDSE